MYGSAQCLPELPDIDLALVHALQVAPRAPWSAIARTLGVDPATAARRWDRLVEERLAWFVVRPSAEQLAPDRDGVLLKLRCRPGAEARVGERIAAVPEVYAVDLLAGDDDLAVVLIGRGIATMRQTVEELVASDPDIVRTRMYFLAEVHREDGQWQLDVLTEEQRSGLARPRTGPATPPDAETLEKVTQILREDPRMSVADIGRRLDKPEPTARRLLERVLSSGALRLGCDVVASAGGAGRAVLLEVCTDDPHAAGRVIGAERPVLRCAAVIGPANLALVARFASLDAVYDLETRAAANIPGWRVRNRATVVRSVKRQGHVLDDDGRVVLDPYGAA
ncbi:Lrp/AsnC family transcriptional regulator [Aeromicrobium senzhongii]|uniref:Lrp/AsnC family transcriptional regulator n=1 Tax=Aeromicrobium senzhongii TaxID=2663859 RepID=A0A8I0EVX8_9ACTN|nr:MULTISPECIES: Lrp/AsnC family transcriptional regulator [Aeromicrobium]MBC9227174.1 Lrp/AsnC family transcriptional regulator [Aeromicrobium senzhongii]QNL94620.1 Lrp/AsnC family transcriptional regulator [Aeromicrobium senzhongii]